jgi:hypothetical protein
MIEFQDDDGAWSRVTASGLPLDQVGLSALAFKTFVRLGGGESEPDRARRAMDFLLKRQRPDGSFSSSLLTTAVVVTALDEAAILGGEPALADTIDRGRRFLRRHRGADGSWSSGSGSERDDLLTTAFAARALGVGDGRLVASLRRKTEAILREARSLDGNEIDIRLALCLASRVSAGEDPTAPELEEPARVLFDRFTDGTDPLGLYFKGVFASTRGGEEWLRIQDQIEANQGMGTSAPEIDLIEILALVLLEGRG